MTGAVNCSLATSIFSLQFMPKTHRQQIIDRIYEGLVKGGAFIFQKRFSVLIVSYKR